MFQITRHEDTRRTYPRAYSYFYNGNSRVVFVGNVARLTQSRKADMFRKLYDTVMAHRPGAMGYDGRSDSYLAAAWDAQPIVQWNNVETVVKTITAEDGSTRMEWDYSHDMGCGDNPLENVTVFTVK